MNRRIYWQYLLLIINLILSMFIILLSINNVMCVNVCEGRGGISLEFNLYFVVVYSFIFYIMTCIRRNNWMKYILLVIIISIVIISIVNYNRYPFVDGYYDSNSLSLHYFGSDYHYIVAGIEDYFTNLLLIIVLSILFIFLNYKKDNEQ